MAAVNQRVGEYVLQERVNSGTFGEIWKAHHHVWSDQIVAIKIPTDPQFLKNLQEEGSAIRGLTHPNVVRALGFDPFAQVPYLTMEFIPGTSLRPVIQRRNLSIPDAVAIMRQVLSGLGYAHKQGIVHRDVKPENILVHERAFREGYGAEGVIKVTDFGLGRSMRAGGMAESIAISQSMNTPDAREIAGTLDYMAPEQRGGAAPDKRADLYACGVVLYELLTGERPAGTDLPSDVRRDVPKSLDEAFRRSYARLDKRFTSAEEFLGALTTATPPPLPTAKCENCNKPAKVHLTEIKDGKKTERHFCDLCAPQNAWPPVASQTGFAAIPGSHIVGKAWAPPKPQTSASMSCRRCHQPVEASDQFCMQCGEQLVENVRRCPQCGGFPDATDQFCIFCGQTLTPQASRVSH